MTTKTSTSLDVSSWLAELHMECYKKNLEDYETIKPLLDLKESDIKKLGVLNSKDRSRMMTSLAGYKKSLSQDTTTFIPVAGPLAQTQDAHKSVLRKSSLKKLNIKSFLSSGSSKKSKNSKKTSTDSVHVSELPTSEPVMEEIITITPGDHSHPPVSPTKKSGSSMTADYEELPDVVSPLVRSMTLDPKVSTSSLPRHPAIENEYVPSPENSPNFNQQRVRANTVAAPLQSSHEFQYPQRLGPPHYQPPIVEGKPVPHPLHVLPHQVEQHSGTEDDSPGPLTHKHLSVVSMESGLSFGYDVEKDFNPAHPLESQPWFHGKIQRTDAENLLHEDGDFLVRENTTMSNTYTLTLRWRGVPDHTLIGTTEVISTTSMIRGSAVKYQFDSGAFDSIPELIYNHLKYQIPIDQGQHTLIVNPICRSGNQAKGGGMFGLYATTNLTPAHRSNWSPESSPAASSYSNGSLKRRSGSPAEPAQAGVAVRGQPIRLGKPITPPLLSHRHLSSSSGDLLEATREGVDVAQRQAFSPPPDTRGRAMTIAAGPYLRRGVSGSSTHTTPSRPTSSEDAPPTNNHQRIDSFGDYEVMESVSILKDSPSLGERRTPLPVHVDLVGSRDYARPQSASAGNTLNRPPRERVKYAEIRYPENGPGVIISSGSKSVNYAEVRFARSNTHSTPPSKPHPFSVYDTIPAGKREATPPKGSYQSRADVLSQRLAAGEPTYSTPVPAASRRPPSAHPVTNYATIQFNKQTSLPAIQQPAAKLQTFNSASQIPSTLLSPHQYSPSPSHTPHSGHAPSSHTDAAHDLSSSNDSLLSATSSGTRSTSSPAHKRVMGASLLHSHAPSAKVHKDLPGYEALVKAHTVLQNHSNEELAYHMTRTDAVCFMLAPRPGEDKDIWKERVKQITSSSGAFCGLQTLADPDGEKLWKKLYFRHLNLAQTVTLTVITAGDALERARLLHRYIMVADLLRSEKYANLFSFIGIMQGLHAPQLTTLKVWELFSSQFPEDLATYKTLQDVVASIDKGEEVLAPEKLIIPPIQHLKPVFHFSEQNMVGFVPVHYDYSIVGEYTSIATGLHTLRQIVAYTAHFTINAWRTLEGLQYNIKLMEFLMQDFTRVYLQSMNVQSDDPLERRRRFGLLMDALIDRVESSEAV